ncbi:MAG: sigma-70 family RNA polymerase sigma factor [Bacteroidota bacterium]
MKVRTLEEEKLDITKKSDFNQIYELYGYKAFSFLIHHLQNRQEAEDLLQDVFANLWHKRHQIEVKGKMENFLITSCKYRLIDHFRKNKKISHQQLEGVPEKQVSTTPEDIMVLSELKSKMLSNFKKMPTRTKEVFLLSRKNGLTNKEIAENLKITEKTVEYHIRKTISQLRTLFSFLF